MENVHLDISLEQNRDSISQKGLKNLQTKSFITTHFNI